MLQIREWCREYNVVFKLNSVINSYNVDEDMVQSIKELAPKRWKVFQCLILEGENSGTGNDLRNAKSFVVSDEQFQGFLDRHKELKCLVPESNAMMRDSYLILDEKMRFLDCTKGSKIPSESILDVGVEKAMENSGFDEKTFVGRLGVYEWTKDAILALEARDRSW